MVKGKIKEAIRLLGDFLAQKDINVDKVIVFGSQAEAIQEQIVI